MSQEAVSEEVSVEVRGDHVAVMEFSRPPHNFFDAGLIEQIADAYEALDSDPASRAIVLCSAGKHFCAGANFAAKNPAEGGNLYEQAIRLFSAPAQAGSDTVHLTAPHQQTGSTQFVITTVSARDDLISGDSALVRIGVSAARERSHWG